ncbi:unnamed protein product [Macrosiphum euphorbiae]|uniref:Uncharacterized protein n=1 Tax=Macrosiphum euphorbiae TaxID=13131 RepID=A0AAV0VJG5_9HEMI|nr:unnamed protein product [Macrosiphum euphorbiae]
MSGRRGGNGELRFIPLGSSHTETVASLTPYHVPTTIHLGRPRGALCLISSGASRSLSAFLRLGPRPASPTFLGNLTQKGAHDVFDIFFFVVDNAFVNQHVYDFP